MEWVGVGMVFVGGILLYSAVRPPPGGLWNEFLYTLQTAKLQGVSGPGPQPITSTPPNITPAQALPAGGGGRVSLS